MRAASAEARFDAAAPSYHRNVLRWIAAARTEPPRAKRIGIVTGHAVRGEKAPNY
jgi:hypothetical protein